MIPGTTAYMSPEQATGRPADQRRAATYAGCVLFETGEGTMSLSFDDVQRGLSSAIASSSAIVSRSRGSRMLTARTRLGVKG